MSPTTGHSDPSAPCVPDNVIGNLLDKHLSERAHARATYFSRRHLLHSFAGERTCPGCTPLHAQLNAAGSPHAWLTNTHTHTQCNQSGSLTRGRGGWMADVFRSPVGEMVSRPRKERRARGAETIVCPVFGSCTLCFDRLLTQHEFCCFLCALFL